MFERPYNIAPGEARRAETPNGIRRQTGECHHPEADRQIFLIQAFNDAGAVPARRPTSIVATIPMGIVVKM